jgi:hypothetical protein
MAHPYTYMLIVQLPVFRETSKSLQIHSSEMLVLAPSREVVNRLFVYLQKFLAFC